MSFEIELYETEDGKSQVKDFILDMSKKSRARLYQILRLLEEKGFEIRMPYSRFLDDGIFEVRVITGSDSSRILYFFVEGKKIILTNGFTKRTQKTPKEEIQKALKIRADYFRRQR